MRGASSWSAADPLGAFQRITRAELGKAPAVGLVSAQLPGPFARHQSSYLPVLPRVALNYETPIGSMLKLMYGRAFRAPSITELTIAHNPVITGGLATNRSLRPELVDTGELAYTQNLFSRLSITGTGYLSYAHNLITPGQALTPADVARVRMIRGLPAQAFVASSSACVRV